MALIKFTLRLFWWTSELIVAVLLLYLSFAISASIIPVAGDDVTSGVTMYVKTNGVHTDICLPVKQDEMDWTSWVPLADFPQVNNPKFIAFGWGDKGFFLDTPTWDDLTFKTAFTAAFLPSPTAMHVQYLEAEPTVSGSVKSEQISSTKYRLLIQFVKDSFVSTNTGSIDLIPNKGYWYNDNFYEAKGSYHLFNTCNKWTNDALKIAGVKTAWLALFSDGIMRHLD